MSVAVRLSGGFDISVSGAVGVTAKTMEVIKMPDMLIKQFVSKVSVDDDERTVTAVISTVGVDRDKEVLLSKGANLDQYLKNPIVLWAHSYTDTPIGKSQWIKKTRKNLTAKVKFAEAEVSAKADEIYNLFKGGFLNAFSVGFIPTKEHEPTPDEIKKKPEWAEARRIYDEWELLEFSAVPVPANPDALAMAVKTKDLDLSKETADEMGVEDDSEIIYATASSEDEVVTIAADGEVKIESDGTDSGITVEPLIAVEAIIKTTPEIRSRPYNGLLTSDGIGNQVQEVIKEAKGVMY